MPTTFDYTNGSPAFKWEAGQKVQVLKNRITVTDTTANTDIVQALDVPKGFLMLGTVVKIVTAALAGNSVDVGDGAGADSWDANIDLTAAAGTVYSSTAGTDAYATTMKLYTADDTIDLTVNADIDNVVLDVFAFGFQIDIA